MRIVRILSSVGSELFRDRTEPLAFSRDRLAEAKIVAENSDVVILCVGLDETLEGEEGDTGNSYASGDKESLKLPQSQIDLMEAMAGSGKPVVLCLMAGSDIDMSYAAENLMQLWFCGIREVRAEKRQQKFCLGKTPHPANFRLPFTRALKNFRNLQIIP